jgi:sterol desaturase/sphingolipid hydroxylase (fatty acid hydroxylase superfamily)
LLLSQGTIGVLLFSYLIVCFLVFISCYFFHFVTHSLYLLWDER